MNFTMMKICRRKFLLSMTFLLLLPVLAAAGGPVHGAKGSAMGTAFVAVADDPSAIAYNPSGLTQLTGTNIYGGLTLVIPSTSYENSSGQTENTAGQVFFPPSLYAASDLGTKDLRLGLGIFSPFGIGGRKWSSEGLTRYSSVNSQIATLSINPTLAYQILPVLSVGFGVNYMLSKNEARKMIDQSMMGAGDAAVNLKGSGHGWGYNVGVMFIPDEKLSLGLAYRSRIKVTSNGDMTLSNIAPALQPLFGGSEFSTGISTTSTFPDIISLGAAYRPLKELTLALDFEQIQWSSFSRADITLTNKVPAAGFSDSSVALDWRDIWTIKAGAEYKVNDRLALRGGYAYVATPVPDRTLEAGNPDSTQHNFSLGFGYRRNSMTLDFFYMAGFYTDRTVSNSLLSGKYGNFVHYAGLSLGQRF